ncbi:hypothetical protein AFCDBAGC_5165 [Methylobacterium cerastii]|uniref:Hedgehog/Intein (Hint) domain-containing protein n=1 Tax=Methylobacterium cerastii TaxID=932741 RepID=A0ABQ4QRN2_9HYPH|nr:hypothetical protein [Methylobacterium cerastii]GJD47272.1 hypothetical protein AFCDBAGC_5165 [Methylobacterium cerastii]
MKVSLRPLLQHEYLATGGRFVADSIACQLTPKELLSVSAALHSVAFCCDALFLNPEAKPKAPLWIGGTLADNVTEGEALIVFADAHPRRGYSGAHLSISDIANHRAAANGPSPRIAKANTVARALSRGHICRPTLHALAPKETPEIRHDNFCSLAAHVLDDRTFDRLVGMTDGVPIIAIVGDTRSTGITSGRFFVSVTTLPGVWLGMSEPAGRC